jgi:hypothetical protein
VSGTGFLQPRRRALTGAEKRLLRARAASLRGRGQRASSRGVWIGVAAIGALWALTLLASDAPVLVVTGFWLVVGGLVVAWVARDLRADRRTLDSIAAGHESALRRNLADVYDVRSSAFVAFEEIEDEGACYAFQLAGSEQMVFLSGQELYEDARFPSLDFSLVFPLDEAGRRVDMLIDKRGAKAAPERVVPAAIKDALTIPEDLRIVLGSLDDLEQRLGSRC